MEESGGRTGGKGNESTTERYLPTQRNAQPPVQLVDPTIDYTEREQTSTSSKLATQLSPRQEWTRFSYFLARGEEDRRRTHHHSESNDGPSPSRQSSSEAEEETTDEIETRRRRTFERSTRRTRYQEVRLCTLSSPVTAQRRYYSKSTLPR